MPTAVSVLVIVENLPVPFDRRVWLEARTLRESGYTVSVISPMGQGFEAPYETLDGIHVYRHPLPAEESSRLGYLREYAVALKWQARLARRVARERGIDVVHLCNPPDILFLVALMCRVLYGAKIIFDHHDLSPELYEQKFGHRGLFYRLLLLAERLTFWSADRVISTNETYREIAIRRGGKAPEDVHIVRSGPELERFGPVASKASYGNGRPHLVGYVGVMGEQEGLDLLLRAVAHIVHAQGREDIHFMLIGDGPVADGLKALAVELGVGEYVEFTGRVSESELLSRLSACHVCVDPDPKNSFNDASTMNKVLEYMALGKPIVQFDVREGRRSAGGAAVYAEPNDEHDFARKLLWLLENPEECARMGAEGRARMEKWLAWSHQAPKLLECYGSLGLAGVPAVED